MAWTQVIHALAMLTINALLVAGSARTEGACPSDENLRRKPETV